MSQRQTEFKASALKVAYDRHVALDLSELALSGNVIALIGHNGAGKSTLIKTLLELLPAQSGTFSLCEVVDGQRTRLCPHEHMTFCPETGAVFADIPVESYIKLWCRIKHDDALYYRHQGADIIEMLSLAPLLPMLGRELSKGQRRRVQTAIGFLTRPRLFLFDEPFDGLDVQKSHELAEIFTAQSTQMSFIISSHRMDVVERLADVVIVLKEGRIVSAGSLDRVCTELCAQSIHISNLANPSRLLTELRGRFPASLVNRIGDHISVTGAEFDLEMLREFVAQIDRNGAQMSSVKPSLTDAMNYHLRKMR